MNLQIFGPYYSVMGITDIVFRPMPREVLGESFLGRLIQAREGGLGGAEVFPEEGNRLGRAERIVEEQFRPTGLQPYTGPSQPFSDDFFDSPK